MSVAEKEFRRQTMGTYVTVRIASTSDFDSVLGLVTAFRDHLGGSIISDADLRRSGAILLKDGNTEFFLACDDLKAPIGYVQSRYRYSLWASGLQLELEDLFVVHQARRRGVGLRLVDFAIARAIERGCRSIGLNTNERNEGALTLYRRLGFASERALWNGGRQLWLQKSLDPS